MLQSRLPPGWRRQWLLTALVLALFLSTENNKRNKDVSSNCWDQRGLQHNSASLSSSFISSTPQCGGELELL